MKEDIKPYLNQKVAENMGKILTLQNDLAEQQRKYEKQLDDVFAEFVTVIDTFEKSEAILKERGLDQDENASKAIKRLLNAKKKALSTLEKFNVKKLEFPEGILDEDTCSTVDSEPDANRKDDEIISIEKEGYTRNGHLIRRAEVVIVKN